RFVQLTPPGSACSIAFGEGLTSAAPGSVQGLQMVVSDAHAARAELAARGLDVGEVEVLDWGSFIYFKDPDGNAWAIQQLPTRPIQACMSCRFRCRPRRITPITGR